VGLDCPVPLWESGPGPPHPLPASLTPQPAEPELENTSQFNPEQARLASAWLLRSRCPAPWQMRGLSQSNQPWPGLSPVPKHRRAEVGAAPQQAGLRGTRHSLRSAVRHLSPRSRGLRIAAGVGRGRDEQGGCSLLPSSGEARQRGGWGRIWGHRAPACSPAGCLWGEAGRQEVS